MINQQKITQLLEHHGYPVKTLEKVKTGRFNDSYKVTLNTPDSQKVFLRIAPSSQEGLLFYERDMMKQEPAIHKRVRENTSIPVPEIFVYDESGEIIPQPYMIMEYIEGTSLSLAPLSGKIMGKVMQQTGKYLRELHQNIYSDQYGYRGEHHCMEPQKSWKDAFEIMWNKLIEDIYQCGVYSIDDKQLAEQALQRNLHHFDYNQKASLLHMDIWGQNILVDDKGNIQGILDWDRALWGDPEIEFAVLDYVGFDQSSFWEGYGNKPEASSSFNIRKVFYLLYEVQKYLVIWTCRRSGMESQVNQYRQLSLNQLDKI